MDTWGALRDEDYDADEAWGQFQKLTVSKPAKTTQRRTREMESDFLIVIMPLVGKVMRKRFSTMQVADRDDTCSILSLKILKRVQRHSAKIFATGDPSSFTALMFVLIKNLIYDHLRCSGRDVRDVPPELFYVRPQLSVPKTVELNIILAELPEQITAFAVSRDRFGFGPKPIRTVARMMVVGKDVPIDMLRNWLNVEHPERCVAFVTLMARWFLHKYRDKFAPVLDGELAEQVASIDQRCHIL